MDYLVKDNVRFECGFYLTPRQVVDAIYACNQQLLNLPTSLFKAIDYKTTSAMIGCMICENIAINSNGQAIVNPIEKGHPDILPNNIGCATEAMLRNYPDGLEVKCTIGGISKGSTLKKAEPRYSETNVITWQAHHQEVSQLLGLVYDYIKTNDGNKPIVTAAFYSSVLRSTDWGAISGTKGRNTKVCGMLSSGKRKMADGWFAVLDDDNYINLYERIFNTRF